MSTSAERLSVPVPRKSLPRPISDAEYIALAQLADVLCGPSDVVAPPSGNDDFRQWLTVALAARSDCFDTVIDLAARGAASAEPLEWLRTLAERDPEWFQQLSTVLGGAYLMVPAVRDAVGYPGQPRDPAGLEEAADEISDGILDPVLDRGHFFIPTPQEG